MVASAVETAKVVVVPVKEEAATATEAARASAEVVRARVEEAKAAAVRAGEAMALVRDTARSHCNLQIPSIFSTMRSCCRRTRPYTP